MLRHCHMAQVASPVLSQPVSFECCFSSRYCRVLQRTTAFHARWHLVRRTLFRSPLRPRVFLSRFPVLAYFAAAPFDTGCFCHKFDSQICGWSRIYYNPGEARLRKQCSRFRVSMKSCGVPMQLYEVAWTKGEVEALNDVMSDSHSQRDMLHPGSSSTGRQGIQRGITRCCTLALLSRPVFLSTVVATETRYCM